MGEVSVLEVKVQPLLPVSRPDWAPGSLVQPGEAVFLLQYFSSRLSPPAWTARSKHLRSLELLEEELGLVGSNLRSLERLIQLLLTLAGSTSKKTTW